jgi:hypothetical protein
MPHINMLDPWHVERGIEIYSNSLWWQRKFNIAAHAMFEQGILDREDAKFLQRKAWRNISLIHDRMRAKPGVGLKAIVRDH